MKKLILSLLALLATTFVAEAYTPRTLDDIPNVNVADARCFTSNPDGILSAAAVDSIDRMLYSLREDRTAEVAVVAVESIGSEEVFEFSHSLFQKWGIGEKERNNGLLMILVLDQREIRFITGYGVEGILPDALCRRIQAQYMLPSFREEDWDSGMVAGVAAVCEVLHFQRFSVFRTSARMPWQVRCTSITCRESIPTLRCRSLVRDSDRSLITIKLTPWTFTKNSFAKCFAPTVFSCLTLVLRYLPVRVPSLETVL